MQTSIEPTDLAEQCGRRSFSLLTLILTVTLIAVGFAWSQASQQLGKVTVLVQSLRPLVRELRVDDVAKISAIARLPTAPNEIIFDVYIPKAEFGSDPSGGATATLCLGLREITGDQGDPYPKPIKTVEIPSGRHSIEVRRVPGNSNNPKNTPQLEVLLDDEVVLQAGRPADWTPSSSWYVASDLTEGRTFAHDEPAELYRLRFNRRVNGAWTNARPDETTDGVLLWFRPLDVPASSPLER